MRRIVRRRVVKRDPPSQLLPILRDWNADDLMADIAVHRRFTDDVAVFLAHVGPTPHGTIGMNYLLTKHVAELQAGMKNADALDGVFQAAYANLSIGLRGKAMRLGDDDHPTLFVLEREGGFAACAVALPDFYEKAYAHVGTPEVVVVVPDPNWLIYAAAGSPAAEQAVASLEQDTYDGALEFTPAAFLLDGSSVRTLRRASA